MAASVKRLWADSDREPFRVTLAILEAFHREALAAVVDWLAAETVGQGAPMT